MYLCIMSQHAFRCARCKNIKTRHYYYVNIRSNYTSRVLFMCYSKTSQFRVDNTCYKKNITYNKNKTV